MKDKQRREEIKQYDTVHAAVRAALDVIDEVYPELNKSEGPCGDALAAKLHKTIEKAIIEARGI